MTNPLKVEGKWRFGWTLDVHTISSIPLGPDANGREQFDTTRSALGELVYQLKYRGQGQEAAKIAAIMADFLRTKPNTLSFVEVVLPMPPSTVRSSQPVVEIAKELGKLIGKPVVVDAVQKIRDTPGLKGIQDPEERRELLDGAFQGDPKRLKGKGVLLIDDLYRSGSTANAVTLAMHEAGASRVYLLAATRTRSKV
jgi:competence protein ComFC